ncbi:MAG: type II secretion system minor pseudopilin GspK [Candidatus Binatia bacterium]
MSRRRERGVALLATVVAIAALGTLALGLASTAAVDQRLTQGALAALQADALARSGVAVARALLGDRGDDGTPDTLDAVWMRPSGRQPLGPGWVEAVVEDEARHVDLNAALLADAVPPLLATLGLDPGLADAIADWTDTDQVPRPHGAEGAAYLGLAPPRLPPDRPLATVGELALVRGLDARAVTRLRPFVTVAGESTVNPNTAPREVLLAVLADPALVEHILDARRHGPLAPADVPDPQHRLSGRSQHYTVRVTAGVGDVRRVLEATLWSPGTGDPAVTAWRTVVP